MKKALLLSALSIVLLSSCSTAFKAGQTPDDVYYSPGVDRPEREERVSRDEAAEEYYTYLDDRYLRMKVANRYRWGSIDNFDYWNDSRYDFNSYSSYNYYNTTNPYAWNHGWNLGLGYGYRTGYMGYNNWGWNSPFYTVVSYGTPSFGTTSGSNISAYRNKSYNNSNYGFRDPKTGNFIPGNNNGFGSLLKKVFTPGTENTSSYDRPVRTYQPSTTSTPAPAPSSSAGGSSGGYGSTGSSSSSGRGGRGN